jgi:hypothetical protein
MAAQTKVHFADFGNHVAIPVAGEITITLPETCNKLLLIFESTVRDEGYDIMLNPDDELNQGPPVHNKHRIHIPGPPTEGTYLWFDSYLIHSVLVVGTAGSRFSYLGMITSNEPRTSYMYDT